MTKEQLDKLLNDGKITQGLYDELLQGLDDNKKKDDGSDDELERKIQSIVDRATNKLGNENKSLREQLEKMKKEKLTDEELKQLKLTEKDQEIQKRENELKAQENRMYAIKAIKKAGLDDGSDTALELVDFVVADDESGIDARVKTFGNLVNKLVQAKVDETFKQNGGKPPKGGNTGGGDNPWKKETFNLTKQMHIELTNPELAKQLKAAAEM